MAAFNWLLFALSQQTKPMAMFHMKIFETCRYSSSWSNSSGKPDPDVNTKSHRKKIASKYYQIAQLLFRDHFLCPWKLLSVVSPHISHSQTWDPVLSPSWDAWKQICQNESHQFLLFGWIDITVTSNWLLCFVNGKFLKAKQWILLRLS